jgi:hypothetical protein
MSEAVWGTVNCLLTSAEGTERNSPSRESGEWRRPRMSPLQGTASKSAVSHIDPYAAIPTLPPVPSSPIHSLAPRNTPRDRRIHPAVA